MARKYTKSKALSSRFSVKSIVSYLGGAQFKTLFEPLCMHKNVTRPYAYFVENHSRPQPSSKYTRRNETEKEEAMDLHERTR